MPQALQDHLSRQILDTPEGSQPSFLDAQGRSGETSLATLPRFVFRSKGRKGECRQTGQRGHFCNHWDLRASNATRTAVGKYHNYLYMVCEIIRSYSWFSLYIYIIFLKFMIMY